MFGLGMFQISGEDLKKIGIGAVIAGLGALLIYAIEGLGRLDFGIWTAAVTALAGILVNLVRKWLADNTK